MEGPIGASAKSYPKGEATQPGREKQLGLTQAAQTVTRLNLESAPLKLVFFGGKTAGFCEIECLNSMVRQFGEGQTNDLFPEKATSCDLALRVCRMYESSGIFWGCFFWSITSHDAVLV